MRAVGKTATAEPSFEPWRPDAERQWKLLRKARFFLMEHGLITVREWNVLNETPRRVFKKKKETQP